MKTEFYLPNEKRELERSWWTIDEAAKAWDVHYTTALRLLRQYPTECCCMQLTLHNNGRTMQKTMIAVGTPKPSANPRGNPNWLDSDLQREKALERWEKSKTAADMITEKVEQLEALYSARNKVVKRQKYNSVALADYNQLLAEIDGQIRALVGVADLTLTDTTLEDVLSNLPATENEDEERAEV